MSARPHGEEICPPGHHSCCWHCRVVDAAEGARIKLEAEQRHRQQERDHWLCELDSTRAERDAYKEERDEVQRKYARECAGTWSRLDRIRHLEQDVETWKRHCAEARWVAAKLCNPSLTQEERRAIYDQYPWMEEAMMWVVMADVVNEAAKGGGDD